MGYILSFLEGVITFISPCLLPMLPVYISYFAGQDTAGNKAKTLANALGFVLGFSAVFLVLGAFAGTLGGYLRKYSTAFNTVSGVIVILFGLNFMGVIRAPFINTSRQMRVKTTDMGFFASALFGAVFSVSWTPCVGAFLGSALMLAAQSGKSLRGILMLLCFSLGLGVPFIISALLIDKLKSAFDLIKAHFKAIHLVSGGFLVIIGVFMAAGIMGYYMSLLT